MDICCTYVCRVRNSNLYWHNKHLIRSIGIEFWACIVSFDCQMDLFTLNDAQAPSSSRRVSRTSPDCILYGTNHLKSQNWNEMKFGNCYYRFEMATILLSIVYAYFFAYSRCSLCRRHSRRRQSRKERETRFRQSRTLIQFYLPILLLLFLLLVLHIICCAPHIWSIYVWQTIFKTKLFAFFMYSVQCTHYVIFLNLFLFFFSCDCQTGLKSVSTKST